jgi:hypothetical protein
MSFCGGAEDGWAGKLQQRGKTSISSNYARSFITCAAACAAQLSQQHEYMQCSSLQVV